jgi:hypothetical protein
VPQRRVAGFEHAHDRGWRQHIGDGVALPRPRIAIAARRPAQQLPSVHGKRLAVESDKGGVGQIVECGTVQALLFSAQPFTMKHIVHCSG